MNKYQIIFVLCLFLSLILSAVLFCPQVFAQNKLNANQVIIVLNAKINQGSDGPSLWNTGYEFYRSYPPSPENAKAIYLAFSKTKGNTLEQKKTLKQGAKYWKDIYEQGIKQVRVSQKAPPDPKRYPKNFPNGQKSPLKLTRPQAFGVYYQGKTAYPAKKQPFIGPPKNPYPQDYEQGFSSP